MIKNYTNRLILLLVTLCLASPGFSGDEWQGFDYARRQIALHRKADLVIKVVDDEGKHVQGAEVQVQMQKHAFPFGCAINADLAFNSRGPNPEMHTYLDVFKNNFNSAVMENSMKWYGMTNDDGSPDSLARERMWQCVAWLQHNEIPLRGHNVLWPSWRFSPKFAHALRMQPEKLRAVVNQRIDEAVTLFKGKLTDWDLVNEPAHHRDIMNIFGEDIIVDWYKRASDLDPETPMYVNQWAVLNDIYHKSFIKWVQVLVSHPEASLDGIGIQGHAKVEYFTDPDQLNRMWSILNEYAEFDLPIKITEFDLEGYKGEALQAQALENALIFYFSHPAVYGFSLWGFWDGRHWRNNPQWSFTGESEQAGFWAEDWSEKTAAKVWRKLLFKEWWTDVSGKTAAGDAGFSTRGFLGDYRITATIEGKSKTTHVTLIPEGMELVIEMN